MTEPRDLLLPIEIMWYADFRATDEHGTEIRFSGIEVYEDMISDVNGRQYLKIKGARETNEFSYQCEYRGRKFDYYYMSKDYCDYMREQNKRLGLDLARK